MKTTHRAWNVLFILLFLFASSAFAQDPKKVRLRLKNNGLVPREFRFLERYPDNKYPNVFTAYILPGQAHKVEIKPGTRLSLVNQQEINANMRGLEAPGKPLLVVKPKDDGKTVNLVQP
ncbi:hypothetical protein [Spirosoma montaniterrae]|uniref:Uncharacterized protein n=1 Tax=Spirosoma montaniterrae TaxID=1178516 RepID=A0A1P9WUV3_9BACT|nr:hypothetical protein [Spirosoma montaniterrae]AQG79161.1 hypothetical protein AWR27_07390 [Spirosoma montaniterrae]